MLDTEDNLFVEPRAPESESERRLLCIASCSICAQACRAFADLTPAPPNSVELSRCLRLAEDCADMCSTTWRVVSRQRDHDPEVVRSMLEACAAVVRACGSECERHAAALPQCAATAAACWVCEEACDDLARTLSS